MSMSGEFAKPKPKSNLSMILIVCSLLCLLLCGGAGFLGYQGLQKGVKAMGPVLGCTVELAVLHASLKDYVKEHGKYPTADSWKKELKTDFVKGVAEAKKGMTFFGSDNGITFSDPEGVWGCRVNATKIHPWMMNEEIAGKAPAEIKGGDTTVSFFEGEGTENGTKPYVKRTDKTEPMVMGELREWMAVQLDGEMTTKIKAGAGSPASR